MPAHRPRGLRGHPGRFRVVLDPSGPARFEDQARHGAFELVTLADVAVTALGCPAAQRGDATVGLVPRQRGTVCGNESSDLHAHRLEHFLRRRACRHERRHPPQRCLLLRQLRERLTALGIRDRRGQELRELDQASFGLAGRGFGLRRADAHHAPQRALHDDWRPDAPVHTLSTDAFRGPAGRLCVVDTGGAAGVAHGR